MNNALHFGETEDVAVTVLVDNRADLIVESTEGVWRFIDEPLMAEHGFAALVELKDVNMSILWDAGLTETTLMGNIKRMGIDPGVINKIAISHGHGDHTAGVTEILRAIHVKPTAKLWEEGATEEEIHNWVQWQRIPLVVHPAAFRERWRVAEDGKMSGPYPQPPRDEWEAVGAEMILSEGPYRLGPGCWTTGEVPRLSFEESGRSSSRVYREGGQFLPDDIEEDQAIVINVKDKGLVVVSGCAHSGIVNTVNYAREISGVERIWAVLGGFHLARSPQEEVQRTIDVMKSFEPKVIAPSHCTGFSAICQFARQMPQAFVLGLVGTTYLF
jgi:7,8-dihydropterin-6-yl-methyl-4-(beta-D-ribofuranosyl)aminobenzene 5'-phosphate synthase